MAASAYLELENPLPLEVEMADRKDMEGNSPDNYTLPVEQVPLYTVHSSEYTGAADNHSNKVVVPYNNPYFWDSRYSRMSYYSYVPSPHMTLADILYDHVCGCVRSFLLSTCSQAYDQFHHEHYEECNELIVYDF